MKLRNKNTGEIVDAWSFYDGNETVNLKCFTDDGQVNLEYRSLAELNEEWEDYEPKEFWYIVQDGDIFSDNDTVTKDYAKRLQAIGNYFESIEEAKKAVEKLKAWKRLKDKGFINTRVFTMNLNWCESDNDTWKDYSLLFGEEE